MEGVIDKEERTGHVYIMNTFGSPTTRDELTQITREVRELRARQPQPTHTIYHAPVSPSPIHNIPNPPLPSPSPSSFGPPLSEPMRFVLHNDGASTPLTSSSVRAQRPSTPLYYSTPSSPTSPNRSKYVPQSNSKGMHKFHNFKQQGLVY